MNKRQGYTLPIPPGTYTIRPSQLHMVQQVPVSFLPEPRMMVGVDCGLEMDAAAVYAAFPPEEKPNMETDDELRQRIAYVAGEAELVRDQRLGMKLDAIAERYGLRRRKRDADDRAERLIHEYFSHTQRKP